MNDAILKFGGISIFGFGLLAVFSFLWGSFVFYKKATESHFNDHSVLDSVVLSAFWAFMVGRICFGILNIATFWNHLPRIFLLNDYPGIDKWGVIVGIVLGIYLTIRKIKGKFFDWFDYVSLGVSSGMAIFYAGLAVLSFRWQYFVTALLLLIVYLVLWKVENTYRTLSWYRSKRTSAKSGFISGFSVALWGFISIVEMILLKNFSSLSLVWGLLLFVGGLVLVYIRSGRTVGEDIKIIFKNGKKQ